VAPIGLIHADSPVNGHVESKYTVKSGKWSPLEFVTDPYLRVHGLAPGLNYGNSLCQFWSNSDNTRSASL
jgi:hypothetical protein